MTRTIWKATLTLGRTGEGYVQMPKGARIIHTHDQVGLIGFWFLCDPTAEPVKRQFFVVGTGHPISNDKGVYVGTIHQPPFVWHLFEVEKANDGS